MPCVLCTMDFAFMGGSMGSVVGEVFTRASDVAAERGIPLVSVTASGGARMQENILALMQMAKTVCAVDLLQESGVPYISVVAHPTTGGVIASFAALGDFVVSEPGALLSFAGPRVVQETTRETLPDDFGRAESSLEHGLIDAVITRHELKATLGQILRLCAGGTLVPMEANGECRAASRHRGARAAVPALEPAWGRALEWRARVNSRLPTPFRGLRRRLAERAAESDIWDAVQLARDDGRPYTLDYVGKLVDDWFELHGDRAGTDDHAIVTGIGSFRGRTIAIVGHQKGRDLKERAFRNFGMAQPQGYAKARRVFALADRLGFPVVTMIDTPGAYPGVEAEQAGQAAAIAQSMLAMTRLRVPSRGVRDRRGRIGRRARDRRGRSRADARARDLLGDLAGRLRHDPLARRQPAPQGRGRLQADGALQLRAGSRGHRRARAVRRGAQGSRPRRAVARRCDRAARSTRSRPSRSSSGARRGVRSSAAWACGSRTASWSVRRSTIRPDPAPVDRDLSRARGS